MLGEVFFKSLNHKFPAKLKLWELACLQITNVINEYD